MADEHLTLSLSRTRDPLKEDPDLVAEILRGERPVRLSRGHAAAPLDLDRVGAVVLWTKDPRGLLTHAPLMEAARALRERGVALALQLTVTGLGGTPLEPGIPSPDEVVAAVSALVDRGRLSAGAIKLRVDPLIRARDAGGRVWANDSAAAFAEVAAPFAALGVTRVTASLAQVEDYPRVARRLARLGFEVARPTAGEGRALTRNLALAAAELGMRYSTCVFPADPSHLVEGCVDGAWLNDLLADMGSPRRVTTTLHNRRGRQRPDCRCSFSYDLGYSQGIRHCASAARSWCVYCYSAS
jgi:hypothetical protein